MEIVPGDFHGCQLPSEDANDAMVDGDIESMPGHFLCLEYPASNNNCCRITMYNVLVFLLVILVVGGNETRGQSSDLSSLVQTERLFARTCGEKGIRASFLEFFADDAIAFLPEPANYKAAVKNRPAPDPRLVTLEWEPQAGGVASSGDIGYTTGPSVRTDNTAPGKPVHYGLYFSVWKKQAGGTWKVAVDIGVSTPAQSTRFGVPFKELKWRPFPIQHREQLSTDGQATIMSLDTDLSKSCSSLGATEGYLSCVDNESMLYCENSMPITGSDSIRAYLANKSDTAAWHPLGGGISSAADLGYSYGSYEYAGGGSSVEKGYYLHVWKRTSPDSWKIVADVMNPIEPGDKK